MSTTLQFLGAAGDVTGSSFLVTTDKARFLVDCGLFQGGQANSEHNYEPFDYDPTQIDFMILTHAHLDHCGLIPRLFREGFRGPIYATSATFELAQLILADAAHIQENGADRRQMEVLFDQADAQGCFQLFKTHHYTEAFEPASGIKACFQDAGHILGSAMVEIWIDNTKFVFSGDIGNSPVPVLRNPTVITEADYVVCESTYGDRLHDSITQRDQQLLDAVEYVHAHKGKLIIPSFAIERTQDLLYCLNNLYNAKKLPDVPVFLDSPLAIHVTDVYRKFTKLFDEDFQKLLASDSDLFSWPNFTSTPSTPESKALNDREGAAVYIAGSGMADAGRVRHHLAHHLDDPSTQVLFVGFQAPGTLGRELIDGASRVQVDDNWIKVRAQINNINSFSAHADQAGLIKWIGSFTTKPTIFLVHGENSARTVLAQKVEQELKLTVHTPELKQSFEL